MNKVTVVADKFVYKRYGLETKRLNESIMAKKYADLAPFEVPAVLYSDKKLCIFEKLDGIEEATKKYNNKKRISTKVAKMVFELYENYQHLVLPDVLHWKKSVEKECTQLEKNLKILSMVSSAERLRKILAELAKLENTPVASTRMSLIHGDLHIGNLLKNDTKYAVIDFEHSLEGPLELEIQNSIFWNDEKSLDINTFITTLEQCGYKYSSNLSKLLGSFYLASQLNMAVAEQNLTKTRLLLAKTLNKKH